MAKLIFIRHGESEANKAKVFAGQSNPVLTEKGKLQAELMCEWLISHYDIKHIYSSDLMRAYETALAISTKLKKDITKNPAFREIYAGNWQGKEYTLIMEKYPEEYGVWLENLGQAHPPKGESVKELGQRVVREVLNLAKKHKDETIVIVTHATPIRMLMTYLQFGDFDKASEVPWVPNASANVINFYNDGAEFELIGYDDYLEKEKSAFPSGII